MEWLFKILPFLKSKHEEQRLNEMKFILAEVKELREYHRTEAREQRNINDSLNHKITSLTKENAAMRKELSELRKKWEQCLGQWKNVQENYIVTLQKLIFKTKGKHEDDEIL
jgi:maltooligosyltrehalose synthase